MVKKDTHPRLRRRLMVNMKSTADNHGLLAESNKKQRNKIRRGIRNNGEQARRLTPAVVASRTFSAAFSIVNHRQLQLNQRNFDLSHPL